MDHLSRDDRLSVSPSVGGRGCAVCRFSFFDRVSQRTCLQRALESAARQPHIAKPFSLLSGGGVNVEARIAGSVGTELLVVLTPAI
jgi:hypothetical protein